MLRYNLRLTLRNLFKNRVHTLINIFGLSTGIACFILISIFVYYEWHYDDFHQDADRIYQVLRVDINPDGSIRGYAGNTPEPLTATLRNEYAQYGTTIGIYSVFNEKTPVVSNGEEHYGLTGVSVDPEFFTVFNFPLITGNPKTCLQGPNDVVITEKAAKIYFGDNDPVGKMISLGKKNFIVRGVARNFPNNTVFKYDVFFSSEIRKQLSDQLDYAWWSSGSYNFIKLNPGVNPDNLREAFNDLKKKHIPDWLMNVIGFDLQPLNKVHLNTDVASQLFPAIDPKYLTILLIVAISVLLIACINYINLSTSQAGKRAKETGVKKVAGANRAQLMGQYFSESVFIALIAVFFAMILAELLLPWFNTLTQRQLELNFFEPRFLLAATGFGMFIGFLSGIYPGLVLSSFKPVIVLKRESAGTGRKSYFRKTLVIIQLTVTIILISTELLILKQIRYMQTAPLGYDLDNILSVSLLSLANDNAERYEQAKLYLQNVSPYTMQYGFSEGTVSENIPGFYLQNQFRISKPGSDDKMEIQSIAIDTSFLDVFKIKLLQGRKFSAQDESSNPEKIIVNEAAVREMGIDSPIGQVFGSGPGGSGAYEIAGVVPDLHVQSLQNKVVPLMFKCGEKNNFPEFVSFRVDPGKTGKTLLFLQKKWKALFPDKPFDYFFPKDRYLDHYGEERRMAKVLAVFVVLTISISALGILAQVLFNTHVRIKEIGIRKTFGASVLSVIGLLSKELMLWILIAFAIASYPAWYVMKHWLENFAYRTTISWWVFFAAIGIIVLVALLTAGGLTWKAARKNPVDVLRYE